MNFKAFGLNEDGTVIEETQDDILLPMGRAPEAPAPVASNVPVSQSAPIYEGYDLEGAVAPAMEQREADYVAPQISLGDLRENVKRQEAREIQMKSSLEQLRDNYKIAQDDARSRELKAEMFAAVGDNIGNIVGGAQAMNTKASVTPTQTSPVKVKDITGRVDAKYRTDYDGLLKQYKDLKDGSLSPKDMLEAQKANAFLKQGEAKLNDGIERDNFGRTMRGATLINKGDEQDELTSKQTDQIVGIDSTLDSLDKLDGMKDYSTGPISGRMEKVKRYIGVAKGNKVAMAAQLEMLTSQYGKAISGATIADQEMARIKDQLPKETDSDEQFAEKLANFQDEMTRSRSRVVDSFKRSGRNTRNFDNRVTQKQIPGSPESKTQTGTIRIQAPSGKVATVSVEAAEKYLARPGYKKVD